MSLQMLKRTFQCGFIALFVLTMVSLAEAGPLNFRVTDAEAGDMSNDKQAIHLLDDH